jgi:RimJ/RimL family protein N-acetyltransferase
MTPTMLIKTNRLLLRPLTTGDLDDLVELHAMPEVKRTMGGAYDRASALARLELTPLRADSLIDLSVVVYAIERPGNCHPPAAPPGVQMR